MGGIGRVEDEEAEEGWLGLEDYDDDLGVVLWITCMA